MRLHSSPGSPALAGGDAWKQAWLNEYLFALQATWLTGATALQLSPLMVAEEVGHWLEATGCHVVVTLDLLAPAVMGALERGPLEHVVLASLARRIAMWRGMIYRIIR